ncbi:MAG: RNA polymerase sigma factor [Candidatus Krumholzibacteria bacterium]|nr:RNA polymerase sigma factor [Candidatus Krumholzibacteria bacterium]
MNAPTDQDLVRRSIMGDGRAFASIVERHTRLVYAAVRSVTGDNNEIDDIVQEVFIRIYRNLGSFGGRSALSTWIYSVARNHAINAVSRARPETVPMESAAPLESALPGPDAELERREALAALERILGGLEGRYREVVELRYLAERRYDEIAELLGVPMGTVKTLLHRARLKMRALLPEDDECGVRDDERRQAL